MLIQQKIGNLKDFDAHNRPVDWLALEWFETNKRLLTKQTTLGKPVNLKFLGENPQYTEGDVLFDNEISIIAIRILPCEVIVIKPRNTYEIAAICYEIGNKHLPLFMEGNDFLIPFEIPLFKTLLASNYVVLKEKRQLLNPLKTSVSPHFNDSGKSLFSRIMDL
jgi:urease accessory protein